MRIRNFVIAVAVLALAVPGLASAQRPHESGFKVTGGGQVVAERDYQGPGDTYGFNARSTGGENDEAVGQFQTIQRNSDGETARGQGTRFHGVVTCLKPTGSNSARFGGYEQVQGQQTDTFFAVDVIDNGEGGNDIVYFRTVEPEDGETPCDDDEEHNDPKLARGNLKIHNGGEEDGGDES